MMRRMLDLASFVVVCEQKKVPPSSISRSSSSIRQRDAGIDVLPVSTCWIVLHPSDELSQHAGKRAWNGTGIVECRVVQRFGDESVANI